MDLTNPVPNEENVEEPLKATSNDEVPLEEAIVKIGLVFQAVPTTANLPGAVVVPISTLPPFGFPLTECKNTW